MILTEPVVSSWKDVVLFGLMAFFLVVMFHGWPTIFTIVRKDDDE